MTYRFEIKFADAEIPVRAAGQLYLANVPDPGSLQFFRNGLLMLSTFGDYLLAGQVIIPNPPLADDDNVVAFYRYAG